MKKFPVVHVLSLLVLLCTFFAVRYYRTEKQNHAYAASIYYVSPSGLDTNPGTASLPFKTFSKAASVLTAGDTLLLYGGTYNEKLRITTSGTANAHISIGAVSGQTPIIDAQQSFTPVVDIVGSYIDISGLTAKNSSNTCELLSGNYITSQSMVITGCISHGTQVTGDHITVATHTIHDSVLENAARDLGGWGSALKVREADDVIIRNNTIYNNYGEGMGIRGTHVSIYDNWVYDNYSVNLYIDNSNYVTAERNLVTCTANTGFYRSGEPAMGISLGMETYTGWGMQFHDNIVRNNFVGYCAKGISYWSSEEPTGGLITLTVEHNTFWGSTNTAISLNSSAYSTGTVVANNIVQQSANKLAYVPSATGLTFHHNYWVGILSSANAAGTGDLTGDVKLLTTPLYNDRNSFKISDTSPAIDKAVSSLVTDGYNLARPYGTASDIGAHEYRPATPELPTTLKNVYFTFGYLKYNQTYTPSRLRSGDYIYLKNYDPKKLQLLAISLYDYTTKGNQGYTRTWKSWNSMYMRTNYLLPPNRQYAFIFTFRDVATGVSSKKYFVLHTSK